MQRTRLDTLVSTSVLRLRSFFGNPWRSVALLIIGILLGFFSGSVIATTAGQSGWWDIPAAASMLVFVEGTSRLIYPIRRRSLWLNFLNVFKVGLMYSLFLEAFKLGS